MILTGRNTTLALNSPTDQTLRTPQFNADGTLNQARLRPHDAGFGAGTGWENMRTVQLQLRFRFSSPSAVLSSAARQVSLASG